MDDSYIQQCRTNNLVENEKIFKLTDEVEYQQAKDSITLTHNQEIVQLKEKIMKEIEQKRTEATETFQVFMNYIKQTKFSFILFFYC